jgi:hypothetical protein
VIEPIQKYSFSNEATCVKVYLPLEGVGARVGKNDVMCTFERRSLSVVIRGYTEGRSLRFGCSCLYGEVDPSGCGVRVLANKVMVTLAKALADTPESHRVWKSLK